jgi:hypothetical protein
MVSSWRNHLDPMPRNFEFAIGKKPLVSIGLMQHSPLVKLGDIERENNYYLKTLPL